MTNVLTLSLFNFETANFEPTVEASKNYIQRLKRPLIKLVSQKKKYSSIKFV